MIKLCRELGRLRASPLSEQNTDTHTHTHTHYNQTQQYRHVLGVRQARIKRLITIPDIRQFLFDIIYRTLITCGVVTWRLSGQVFSPPPTASV